MLRIECDPDGWTLRVNNDASLDTLYHFEEFPLDEIVNVEIFGGGTVSYTGFGDKGHNNNNQKSVLSNYLQNSMD